MLFWVAAMSWKPRMMPWPGVRRCRRSPPPVRASPMNLTPTSPVGFSEFARPVEIRGVARCLSPRLLLRTPRQSLSAICGIELPQMNSWSAMSEGNLVRNDKAGRHPPAKRAVIVGAWDSLPDRLPSPPGSGSPSAQGIKGNGSSGDSTD